MTSDKALDLLTKAGALQYGHYVGTSGVHFNIYVAKDRATLRTSITSQLCEGIAHQFHRNRIGAVVSPAVGGVALSQWTAHHLTNLNSPRPEVLALYSEPNDRSLSQEEESVLDLDEDERGIVRGEGQVLKRGFDQDVRGKRVLVVEDILTTGKSARAAIAAVKAAGGEVIALAVLANGGKVTADACDVDILSSLIEVEREILTEAECAAHGLCFHGVPINTDFGHGQAFLERKARQSRS